MLHFFIIFLILIKHEDENIKFHAPSHSHDFVNETETSTLYTENDERPVI
jgi:hypothetical protein